jgi:shikimate kinase
MAGTLWLVGMMGSGKSTVAPLVARELGLEWTDTDDLVADMAGRRLVDLLVESEEAFRDLEASIVRELAGSELVVACGGGVVTRSDTVDVMRRSGHVIWLRARHLTLLERVGDGAGRPLLGDDPAAALEQIGDERAALYGAAAGSIVEVDERDPDEVAAEVVRAWNASSAG